MYDTVEAAKERFLERLRSGYFVLPRVPNLGENDEKTLDTQAVEAFCTSELAEALKRMR